MTTILGSIFWLIITLGVLVTFHELGHFWVARLFKVKVLRFCVGFGKPIWSRYDKQGTEIAVAPIPLGGYVKLLDTRDCDVAPEDANQTYNSKAYWQKMLIMVAGPAFNFILALGLYWLMFVVGKNEIRPTLGEPTQLMQEAGFMAKDQIQAIDGQAIRTWSDVSLNLITAGIDRRDVEVLVNTVTGTQTNKILPLSQVPADVAEEDLIDYIGLQGYRLPVTTQMGPLNSELPAAKAGLKAGDELLAINAEEVLDWYAVVDVIQGIEQGPIALKVLRGNEVLEITVPDLIADPDDPNRKILGISSIPPSESEQNYARSLFFKLSYGPIEAIPEAYNQMVKITSKSLEMMWKLVTGKASVKNLSGPITIAQVANDSVARGFAWYLSFLALVSLSLGIINLVPIPMLDGGQMLFLTIEKIKGSPLTEQFEVKAQLIGMFMIFCLMSLAFYNDILRSVS
ncbi:RIP metalloprotease RseP [Marinicella sp. S1101]|uniref:RIP metalloprotease RseP n=1 Tax=Marinicella marina TaxID=2996016 RepID=UPI002260B50E|nr:RIP metalloprotease RseP [Marinicella marina]MCX7554811.1 RIP metalloprotease RseP [Marinicella marina]MDJ1140956.1 RIP metalloprotease RseP [Marinicella marina]